jgi:gluconate 2-dehydrogenase gamma chain
LRKRRGKNLLKGNAKPSELSPKKGSIKEAYLGPLASGLNRRAFLRTTTAISLLAGLAACKPSVPALNSGSSQQQTDKAGLNQSQFVFSKEQQKTLDAVQMQLFPEDGNGPNARDLNAVKYLEWAMSDPQNIDDGDPEFINKGIGWLNDLASQTRGDDFIKLTDRMQDKVLRQIANSNAGENWLALLLYYLTEALTLDPVYGGNPKEVGWHWLEHQAGFPRPIQGKTYRDFE